MQPVPAGTAAGHVFVVFVIQGFLPGTADHPITLSEPNNLQQSVSYSQLKTPIRLCALNRSRLFRTTATGGRAELTPTVVGLSAVLGLAFFSDSLTLSPPAAHRASMIDLILHNQIKMKTGVLRSTLRTGNKSGYRAGGRYTNSNR
jgi:hypothetical protein